MMRSMGWDGGLSVSLTVRSLHWPPTSFSRDSRTCLSSSPQISMHTSNASYLLLFSMGPTILFLFIFIITSVLC